MYFSMLKLHVQLYQQNVNTRMVLRGCMFSLFLKVCAENGPPLPLVGFLI